MTTIGSKRMDQKSTKPRNQTSIEAALCALVGEVDSSFSAAVDAMWEARANRDAEDAALRKRLEASNAIIRRFIQRYLHLRPGESVHVSPKQYVVSYNRESNNRRETFRPYLIFDVHLTGGIEICVGASPHPSATHKRMVDYLLRTLDRVQRMVEAAR